jgi:hypothetical protein
MANPYTTFTGVTDVAEIIDAEVIPDFIQGYSYGPVIADIAWTEEIGPRSGPTFIWPRWDATTIPAGTVAEGTEFTEVQLTTSQETATSGVVGATYPISRQAQYDAHGGLPTALLVEVLEAHQARVESDLLSVITGALITSGLATEAATLARLRAALALYEAAVRPRGDTAVILSPSAWGTLADSMHSTGGVAFGRAGAIVDRSMDSVMGYKGDLFGVGIFVSPYVAASGGGFSNVITQIGKGRSMLGRAVWQPPMLEKEPRGGQYGDVWHLSSRYAVSLTNNDSVRPNGIEFLSS